MVDVENVVDVVTRETARGSCVELTGVLAYDTVPSVDRALHGVGSAPGQEWTVDLGGIELCDSSGIAFLLEVRRRALAAGTDLVLRSVPEHLGRYLELLGLDEVFTIGHGAAGETAGVTPIDARAARRPAAPGPSVTATATATAADEPHAAGG